MHFRMTLLPPLLGDQACTSRAHRQFAVTEKSRSLPLVNNMQVLAFIPKHVDAPANALTVDVDVVVSGESVDRKDPRGHL